MKSSKYLLFSALLFASQIWAAEAVKSSPSNGIFKMLTGLALVLIVMAGITWMIKSVFPNIAQHQQAIARVVSSVSVGSRERVVVLQIADRWIVVGVAPGQVNGIANLEASNPELLESTSINTNTISQGISSDFSQWLQKSTAKFVSKNDNKDKHDQQSIK